MVEWCGISLERASFEQVRKVLKSTMDAEEVEVAIMKCRYDYINHRLGIFGHIASVMYDLFTGESVTVWYTLV